MVHHLGGFDPDRCRVVVKWPLREACLCYVELLKDAAREDFRHQQMVYAISAPYTKKGDAKPPRVPDILRPPGSRLVTQENG